MSDTPKHYVDVRFIFENVQEFEDEEPYKKLTHLQRVGMGGMNINDLNDAAESLSQSDRVIIGVSTGLPNVICLANDVRWTI